MLRTFSQVYVARHLPWEDESEKPDWTKLSIARIVMFGIIIGINSVHYCEGKTYLTVQPYLVYKSDWRGVPHPVTKSLCYHELRLMNLFQIDSNGFSSIITCFCHVYNFLLIFKISRLILISTVGKSIKNAIFYINLLNIPEVSYVPE